MQPQTQVSEARRRLAAKRARRRVVRLAAGTALILAGVVAAVWLMPGQRGADEAQAERALTTAAATRMTLEQTVFGAGEVQPASQPGVYAQTDGTVAELRVGLGDAVSVGDVIAVLANEELEAEIDELAYAVQTAQADVRDTATHTQYVYRQLYDEDGEPRFDVNTNEPLLGKYSNEITVRAPAAGKIMAIYIAPGDDALAVYRDKGAVMLLSTDGRMKVELSGLNAGSLALGDAVRVSGEGVETTGTVVDLTRRGTEAVIQILSDAYAPNTPVTVYAADGAAVGEGALAINKPLAVSAYGGTIKGIAVKVGDTVKREDVLARIVWDEIPLYLANDEILYDYVKAKASLDAALQKRDRLTVVAPCDGVIASVDVASGDDVTDGMRLCSLVETGAGMTLTLSVDELDVPRVQPGQQAVLSVDALGATLTGTVRKIAPLGDTSSGVTRYDVTIGLTSEDARVLGGMNVSGEIIVDTVADALCIPTDALRKQDDGSWCVTLVDGTLRAVTLGVMTDAHTQILSGLVEGEVVVY